MKRKTVIKMNPIQFEAAVENDTMQIPEQFKTSVRDDKVQVTF
jgi:hypothetical protein